MKISSLCLVGLLSAFVSCKKDDNNPSSATKLYVSSIVSTQDSIVFDYNADKTLSRWATFKAGATDINSSFLYFPKYEGAKLTSLDFTNYADGTTNLSGLFFPAYNGDIVNRVYTSSTHAGTYDSLIYNSEGKVEQINTFAQTGDAEPAITTYLTWTNNNITRDLRIYNNGISSVTTFTYDDKRNMYNASMVGMTYTDYRYYYCLSANNIKKKVFESVSEAGFALTTTTYTYTYNEHNYPVGYTSVEAYTAPEYNSYIKSDSASITYLPAQ